MLRFKNCKDFPWLKLILICMSNLWKQARVKLSFLVPNPCHSALFNVSSYRELVRWDESLPNSDVNTCPQSISKT